MIKYSDFKKFNKYSNENYYKNLEKIFKEYPGDKNNNRIYFDIQVNPDNFKVKIPFEISEYFNWLGWHENNPVNIIDYQKGICRMDGRQMRIGKVLNKLGQPELLKTYQESKDNTLKNVKDLRVVISRHPYDVMGMSTDRGWSTCVDMYDKKYNGKYLYSLKSDLQRGCLVAYLIRKGDENINNPLSRIRITSGYATKFRADTKTYGTDVVEFRQCVNNWINSVDEKF